MLAFSADLNSSIAECLIAMTLTNLRASSIS